MKPPTAWEIIQPRAILRQLKSCFSCSGRRRYGPLLLYSLIRAEYAHRWQDNLFWMSPRNYTLREFAARLGVDLRTVRGSWQTLVAGQYVVEKDARPDGLTSKHDSCRMQYLPKGARVFQLMELEKSANEDGIMDKYQGAILARRDLSDLAKVLFILISSLHHSNGSINDRCKPEVWYATVLGAHRSKIARALAQLRAINAVHVTARRRESDHYKAPSLIEPLPASLWLPDRNLQKGDISPSILSHPAVIQTKRGHEIEQNGNLNFAKWGLETIQNGNNSELSASEFPDPEIYDQEICDIALVTTLPTTNIQNSQLEKDSEPPPAAERAPAALSEPKARDRAYDQRLLEQYGKAMRLTETQLLTITGHTETTYTEVPESNCAELMARVSVLYRELQCSHLNRYTTRREVHV
jgi:hypothetical protein